jgi:transposase-like protein
MSQKRSFTREFKLAAVKKVVEQGLTFREVAKDLGISDSAVRAWKRDFQYDGTLENQIVQNTSVEAELKRLRKENRQLKMERDILKKVTTLFAPDQKLNSISSKSISPNGPLRSSAEPWVSPGLATTNN